MDHCLQVCDAAEKLAAVKCGKHSVEVFKQVALLRVSQGRRGKTTYSMAVQLEAD